MSSNRLLRFASASWVHLPSKNPTVRQAPGTPAIRGQLPADDVAVALQVVLQLEGIPATDEAAI